MDRAKAIGALDCFGCVQQKIRKALLERRFCTFVFQT